MTNILKSLFYISICVSLGISCKGDTDEVSLSVKEQSYGAWVLSEAQKDGKPTKTLEGAQFSIDSSTLKTNLFGEEQSFPYQRLGNKIKLRGDQAQVFTVDKSTADTLILGMKRKRKQFELLLVKDTTVLIK